MIPLQTIDPTPVQTAFAVGVLVVLLLVIIIGQYRVDKRGLSSEAREHIQAVVGRIHTTEPESARFEAAAVRAGDLDPRGRLRELVMKASGQEVDREPAVSEARIAIVEAWSSVIEGVPRRVISLGRLALMAAIFGPIAVSTQRIVALLSKEPRPPSLSAIIDTVISAGESTFVFAVGLLALFPYSEIIFTFGFLLVFNVGTWLFQRWWVIVFALVFAAVVILLYADRMPARRRQATRGERLSGILGGGLIVFAAGVVPSVGLPTVLRVAGLEGLVGFVDPLSLLLAVVLGLWFAVSAVRQRRWSIRVARTNGGGIDPPATAARAVYALSAWLIVVAVPLALAWTVYALATGRFLTVVSAALSADPVVQALLVLGIGSVTIGGGRLLLDNWGEIQSALLEAGAVRRVRAALWLSAFPIAVGTLFYIGLVGILPIPTAVAVAFAMAWAVKFLAGLLSKARYRAILADDPDRTIADPVVDVWVVEDANGDDRYVARVSRPQIIGRTASEYFGHVDVGDFVESVATAVEDLADGETPRPLLADRYAERLMETGETDFETVEMATREEVRKVVFAPVRNDDGRKDIVNREWFDEQVEDLPADLREDVIAEHERLGNLRRNQDVVELRNDPFRRREQARSGVQRVT